MTLIKLLLSGMMAISLAAPLTNANAADSAIPAQVPAQAVKVDLPQPYIVKKGDTLWDIADYFFKEPMKWLHIWEKNLYITNPDLIYPGNKIWFDPAHAGGVSTNKPRIVIRPVQRLGAHSSGLLLTALERQDFIRADQEQGMGYIIASPDDRLNYGAHDRIYLKLEKPAQHGDLFDIFRTTDVIKKPQTGEKLGVLVEHLGQVRIDSVEDSIYRGVVNKAFAEISRGDRLKPASIIDPHLQPTHPTQSVSGHIVYIRNGANEAGQNQVVGIDIGEQQLKTGTLLSVKRAGRQVQDPVTKQAVRLPQEQIGDLIVLVAQQQASIVLITASTAPINIGDIVSGEPEQP